MGHQADKLKSSMSLPLIMAPMFLVSNPDMVLAACKKGIIGSFPALNQRTSEGVEEWLQLIDRELQDFKNKNPGIPVAPYAVNLAASKKFPRLQADLDLCVKYKVPVIISSLGDMTEIVRKVHSYGGIVLHDVINMKHARKAAQAGVDGLIAVAAGAGGHGGTMNPVAMVNEIREFFSGIIVVAGGLTYGKDILAAEIMGADFAYMGTRFINTAESSAALPYKEMICAAGAEDIVYTDKVTGVKGNFLRESLEKAGIDTGQPKSSIGRIFNKASLALKTIRTAGLSAVFNRESKSLREIWAEAKLKVFNAEVKRWVDVWAAGQGVGSIHNIPPVAELIDRLGAEYSQARQLIAQPKPANFSPRP